MKNENLQPRADWFPRGIITGYLASLAMLATLAVAYFFLLLSTQALVGLGSWGQNMAFNTLTASAKSAPYYALWIHLLAGICFALLYGRFVEPRLSGPAWQKGLMFAGIPFLLSLLAFFPLVGAGPLGFGLGAGPLPILGNLVLHAVYGLALGALYGPWTDKVLEGPTRVEERYVAESIHGTVRGGAIGLAVGAALGVIIGVGTLLLNGPDLVAAMHLPDSWVPVAALLVCSALGCWVGLVLGQPGVNSGRRMRHYGEA